MWFSRFGQSRPEAAGLAALSATWEQQPQTAFIRAIKRRSMLGHETLTVMHYLAGRTKGGILEIGSYIGGATTVLAKAMPKGAPMVTIEVGGSYDHPYLPSKDIVGDLHATLAEHGVAGRVSIIVGWSSVASVVGQVTSIFGRQKIGMLVIDANGEPAADFVNYHRLLRRDAFFVIDGYETGGTNEKELPVKAFVSQLVSSRRARLLGVYPWGTWFGQLHSSF